MSDTFLRAVLTAFAQNSVDVALGEAEKAVQAIEDAILKLRQEGGMIRQLISYYGPKNQQVFGPALKLHHEERKHYIRRVAIAVAEERGGIVRTIDVLERLRQQGVDLGVKSPKHLIGSVLAPMSELERIGNQEYHLK